MTGTPERAAGLLAENRRVIGRNLRDAFPGREFTEAEVELAASLRPGVAGRSLRPFLRFYHWLLRDFVALFPGECATRDFRLTVGRHYARMATSSVGDSRGALTVAAAVALHSPAALTYPETLRGLAAGLLGPRLGLLARRAQRLIRSGL